MSMPPQSAIPNPSHHRPPIVRLVEFPAERARTEDELRAIRSRVLNVVGHELRTPATTLRGLADALSTVDATTAQEHVIPAIQRNAERLERLVDDLLIANGITTALPVGRPEPVDVAAAVHEAWQDLGAERELMVERSGDIRAFVHPAALARALQRVLDNAMRLGDAPTTVRLLERPDGMLEIVVDSAGPALHPEEVALATELLFRGEAAVMRTPGLGLGLPVAKALIEYAGGSLHVSAREGGGLVTTMLVLGARGR